MAPATAAVDDRRLLLGSILSTGVLGVLGVLGVVWGIAVRSQMVLLDGVSAVRSISDLEEPELRMTKVGRKLYVDVAACTGSGRPPTGPG